MCVAFAQGLSARSHSSRMLVTLGVAETSLAKPAIAIIAECVPPSFTATQHGFGEFSKTNHCQNLENYQRLVLEILQNLESQ